MAGGVVEVDPEKLAQHCEALKNGAKKLFESGPNEGDMWFFELFHHLTDCAAALRSKQPLRSPGMVTINPGWCPMCAGTEKHRDDCINAPRAGHVGQVSND